MKIPPRTMFTAQVVATTVSCFVQVFVLNFALNNIEGICTTAQKQHFKWWSRLNYLTASGLDTGLAISTLVIFFVFTLNQIPAPNWWYVHVSYSNHIVSPC